MCSVTASLGIRVSITARTTAISALAAKTSTVPMTTWNARLGLCGNADMATFCTTVTALVVVPFCGFSAVFCANEVALSATALPGQAAWTGALTVSGGKIAET